MVIFQQNLPWRRNFTCSPNTISLELKICKRTYFVINFKLLLSPPQRLLLVNNRENGSAGNDGKREIFPLPSLRAPRVYFPPGATVGGLCGGERSCFEIGRFEKRHSSLQYHLKRKKWLRQVASACPHTGYGPWIFGWTVNDKAILVCPTGKFPE